MGDWYDIATIRAAWSDFDGVDDDTLTDIIESARLAVVAYAPTLPEPEQPVLPDPVTVQVDTVGVTGTATVSRMPGDIVRVDMNLDTTDDTGDYFAVLLSADDDLQPLYSTLVSVPSGPTMRYEDAGFLVRAWDPFPADELVLSIFATAATTIPVPTVDVPANYRQAQLLQARNIWNSAYASPTGDMDSAGYGLTTFPLDWSVQQLLRPKRATPVLA